MSGTFFEVSKSSKLNTIQALDRVTTSKYPLYPLSLIRTKQILAERVNQRAIKWHKETSHFISEKPLATNRDYRPSVGRNNTERLCVHSPKILLQYANNTLTRIKYFPKKIRIVTNYWTSEGLISFIKLVLVCLCYSTAVRKVKLSLKYLQNCNITLRVSNAYRMFYQCYAPCPLWSNKTTTLKTNCMFKWHTCIFLYFARCEKGSVKSE